MASGVEQLIEYGFDEGFNLSTGPWGEWSRTNLAQTGGGALARPLSSACRGGCRGLSCIAYIRLVEVPVFWPGGITFCIRSLQLSAFIKLFMASLI